MCYLAYFYAGSETDRSDGMDLVLQGNTNNLEPIFTFISDVHNYKFHSYNRRWNFLERW
jgi:hypothetical protein